MPNQCPLVDLARIVKTSDGEQQSGEELKKTITRKIEKHETYSSFKDKLMGADLADMQFNIINIINKCNKRFQFLLCVMILLVNIPELFL